MAKKSPRLSATTDTVQSQTANSVDTYVLQPNTASSVLHGLFPEVEKKALSKVDDKKVKALIQRLKAVGITNAGDKDVSKALHTEYGSGDSEKAYDLLTIAQESKEGIIKEVNPDVKMLGAVNRRGVSCYLDSILFAMFARLPSFEAILYANFDDEPRKNLGIKLRLWVNLLRSGKLITPDITKQLQEQIAVCGWAEGGQIYQQDASEAFSFITGTLALPMLTLKMDLYHLGKEDAGDDHKFVNERLLEVAIPEAPTDDRPITLEDCLEAYFNNKVEVTRYLERRNTLPGTPQTPKDLEKARLAKIEIAELRESEPSTPAPGGTPSYPASSSRPPTRPRGLSLMQEHYVFEKTDSKESSIPSPVDGSVGRRRAGSLRKAVMMPAWQFFSLIPWYTDSNSTSAPSNDAQVAAHFSKTRPILGICLKRYLMDNKGKARRLDTHIDIPLEIALPHFIQNDAMAEDGPAMGNFKLSLQSIVCHRGTSVYSGHYLSAVRYPNTSKIRDSESLMPPDQWLKHDDLAKERVVKVDIEGFLRHETPYLLFYQVQPIDSDASDVSEFTQDPQLADPPTYAESLGHGSGGPAVSVKTESGFSDPSEPPSEGLEMTCEELRVNSLESGNDLLRPSGEFKRGRLDNRPSNEAGDGRRLSASLSRIAGRMNISRPTSTTPSNNPGVTTRPLPAFASEFPSMDPYGPASTPQSHESSSRGDPSPTRKSEQDGRKLRKEHKDKKTHHHHHHHHHHVLTKGRHHRGEKPERECVLM